MKVFGVLKIGLLTTATIVLLMVTMAMIRTVINHPKFDQADTGLKVISRVELKKYDGSNDLLPIYIGYEGKVYDVSEGKEYYKTGGVYHYLTGKDSTFELNIAGGAIIKRKYPVVGRLE